MKYNTRG